AGRAGGGRGGCGRMGVPTFGWEITCRLIRPRSAYAGGAACPTVVPASCGDQDKRCRMRSEIVRSGAMVARLAGRGLAILVAMVALGPAADAGEEDFYRGKQIRLIISSGPAGVYDTYGRLLARFLPAHLP